MSAKAESGKRKAETRCPVHILAYCRRADLLDAALLVFRTLRTGFPDNPVFVWGNALEDWAGEQVRQFAAQASCVYNAIPLTQHDAWLEELIEAQFHPFWVLDTDLVFWNAMPEPKAESGKRKAEMSEPDEAARAAVQRSQARTRVYQTPQASGAVCAVCGHPVERHSRLGEARGRCRVCPCPKFKAKP
jgi:hypothetical protein